MAEQEEEKASLSVEAQLGKIFSTIESLAEEVVCLRVIVLSMFIIFDMKVIVLFMIVIFRLKVKVVAM